MDDIEIKHGNFTLETMYEIWDEGSGGDYHLEVGLDRDGMGLIEIRYLDIDNKVTDRMTFSKEQAILLGLALKKLVGDYV